MTFDVSLKISGERFKISYVITGSEQDAYTHANDICIEQTIEFPPDLVTGGDIRGHVFGRIESFSKKEDNKWEAIISFATEIVGGELTQFINVMLGNYSLKPGIRVEHLELPFSLLKQFKGPRFGIEGIRDLLGVHDRPLFCTALKPMGLSAKELAELAYQFALGGVDMIKDDHGLADQPFAPFNERVKLCGEAVKKANKETGGKCIYIPNLSTMADKTLEKALFAKEQGAGGLMLAPGLVGFDTMRMLADNDKFGLPIICHPAFIGTLITSKENGVSYYTTFGQLPRLAGADATIFPNYGGRFSFSKEDCESIVKGCIDSMGNIKPAFTMPGGGMNLDRFPEMRKTYGKDVIFLIGGALHKIGQDLIENCHIYMKALSC